MKIDSPIEAGHDQIEIKVTGHTFVKILDSKGELVRHSRSLGAQSIVQLGKQGDYNIETDGEISEVISSARQPEERDFDPSKVPAPKTIVARRTAARKPKKKPAKRK